MLACICCSTVQMSRRKLIQVYDGQAKKVQKIKTGMKNYLIRTILNANDAYDVTKPKNIINSAFLNLSKQFQSAVVMGGGVSIRIKITPKIKYQVIL